METCGAIRRLRVSQYRTTGGISDSAVSAVLSVFTYHDLNVRRLSAIVSPECQAAPASSLHDTYPSQAGSSVGRRSTQPCGDAAAAADVRLPMTTNGVSPFDHRRRRSRDGDWCGESLPHPRPRPDRARRGRHRPPHRPLCKRSRTAAGATPPRRSGIQTSMTSHTAVLARWRRHQNWVMVRSSGTKPSSYIVTV